MRLGFLLLLQDLNWAPELHISKPIEINKTILYACMYMGSMQLHV